ncbi:uncharacterized protein LOC144701256 isoform X2 [Wolffia australiana]
MVDVVPASQGDEAGIGLKRVVSFSELIFGFYEVEDEPWASSEEDDEDDHGGRIAENKAFWESQHHLLQTAMAKCSALELCLRRETAAAVENLQTEYRLCHCHNPKPTTECRSCFLNLVAERLRLVGHDCAVCESKWRASGDVPKGEHAYIDVVAAAKGGRGDRERIVIELRFRQEFEVARASGGYRRLLSQLPEVFVGNSERLRRVIKLVCAAAKLSMKENNLHMPPWRKTKYMQAKWLSPFERSPFIAQMNYSTQIMLLHQPTPVEVV